MIVVAVIGILAAIAVPNYLRFSCRAQQAEAKGNGQMMIKMVQSHIEDLTFVTGTTLRPTQIIYSLACNGLVIDTNNFLGVGVTGKARRYSYLLRKTGQPSSWSLTIQGCPGTSVELDSFTASTLAPALNQTANACNQL